jgi:hypothetical protein
VGHPPVPRTVVVVVASMSLASDDGVLVIEAYRKIWHGVIQINR